MSVRWIAGAWLLATVGACAASPPADAPGTANPSAPVDAEASRGAPEPPASESGFVATPHPFWAEPELKPALSRFEADAEDTELHAHLPSGATVQFAGRERTACGHDFGVVRIDGRRVVLAVFTAGFLFQPEVTVDDLEDGLVTAPTLLYDAEGEAFAMLTPGLELEVLERIDGTWSRVQVVTRPSVWGFVRQARLGSFFSYDHLDHPREVPGEAVFIDPEKTFDVLDRRGDVRISEVSTEYAQLIGRTSGLSEVVLTIDLDEGPADAGSVAVHGWVSEMPTAEEPSMWSRAWSREGGPDERPSVDVAKDAWLHSEPEESARIARAYHDNVRAVLLERGADWSRVELDTVWGVVEGFVPTRDVRDPAAGTRTFVSRDTIVRCVDG